MSDQPPGNPPPPPPYQPPPGYAPLPPQPNAPSSIQTPPPYLPVAAAGAGGGLMSQFGGDAAWSIGFGLASTIIPFVFNYVLFFLPLIGIFYGVRAIMRGRLIGGIVGLVLNVIGGLITVYALTAG